MKKSIEQLKAAQTLFQEMIDYHLDFDHVIQQSKKHRFSNIINLIVAVIMILALITMIVYFGLSYNSVSNSNHSMLIILSIAMMIIAIIVACYVIIFIRRIASDQFLIKLAYQCQQHHDDPQQQIKLVNHAFEQRINKTK